MQGKAYSLPALGLGSTGFTLLSLHNECAKDLETWPELLRYLLV